MTLVNMKIATTAATPVSLVDLLRGTQTIDPQRQSIGMKWSSFERYGAAFQPVFDGAKAVTLSRADVFTAFQQDPHLGALSAIAWGFPRGGLPGGRTLQHALNAIPFILEHIGPGATLSNELYERVNSLPNVKNGITTKLLHFGGITTCEGHRAQIYDSRIHKYLTRTRPQEYASLTADMAAYRYAPTPSQYLEYLRITEQVALELGYSDPSRVEVFMFSNAPGTRKARHGAEL